MSVWSHIILEGFCMYATLSKKELKLVSLNGKPAGVCREHGHVHHSKRPKHCREKNKERIPNFNCLECPFFAYTDADEKDYKIMMKAWKNKVKK